MNRAMSGEKREWHIFLNPVFMKYPDYTGIIPPQFKGKEIEASASTRLKDNSDAIAFYHTAKHRLLDVNNWHRFAGIISAKFRVVGTDGNTADREIREGDYIRIDIPGPGSKEGDGYDWVLVETMKEISGTEIDCLNFLVRPAANPMGDKQQTAHFYDHISTSNFIVMRESLKVTAIILDRNIIPNEDTHSLTDKIRDVAVGIGALGAFSKIQWQTLANGLVDENNPQRPEG